MTATDDRRRRIEHALVGCAVGDLLGGPYENRRPPPAGWQALAYASPSPRWSDDKKQSLVLVDDVLRHGALDARRVMERFVAMRDEASAPAARFGLHRGTGRGFRAAVDAFAERGVAAPMPGRAGNGAAMRVVAVAVALGPGAGSVAQIEALSRSTHDEPLALDAARAVVEAAWALQDGVRGDDVLGCVVDRLPPGVVRDTLAGAVAAEDPFALFADAADRAAGCRLEHGPGGGHALAGPLSAIVLAARAPTLHVAVRDAVRLGGDTDSTAAIAGALRGVVDDVDTLPAALLAFPGVETLRRWGAPQLPSLDEWWALERRLSARADAPGRMRG